MKFRFMLLVLAAFAVTPVFQDTLFAQGAEAPAKPKKKLPKKPFYNQSQIAEARKIAENNNEPLLVFILPDLKEADSPRSAKFFQKTIVQHKLFQGYAKDNFVVLLIKIKPDKEGKKIDVKSLDRDPKKGTPIRTLIENYGISPRAKQLWHQNKKNTGEPDAMELNFYPCVVCFEPNPMAQKPLFYMDAYDREGGFPIWLSTLDNFFAASQIETIKKDPKLVKLLDDPTSFNTGKKK